MRKTSGFSGFRRSRRGNTLLVAILFSAIVIFGVTSYVNVVSNEIPQQAKRMDRLRALEIADAGLEHALWYINDQFQTYGINWWIGQCEIYAEGSQTDDSESNSPEGLFPDGERYEVDIDQVSVSQSGRPTFFVRSSGYITRDLPRGGDHGFGQNHGGDDSSRGFFGFCAVRGDRQSELWPGGHHRWKRAC